MIALRYVLGHVLGQSLAALVVVAVLYLTFDLVESYRVLARLDEGLPRILAYLSDRAAAAVWYVLPGAVLAGSTLALSGLARRGELIALFGAGFGPARLLAATLAVGALAATSVVLVGEAWMPSAQGRIHAIYRRALGGDARDAHGRWLREGRVIAFLGEPGRAVDEARDVTLFELGDAFRPARRLDAERMRWVRPDGRDGKWILEGVTIRRLDEPAEPGAPAPLRLSRADALDAPLRAPPMELRADLARPDALTFAEVLALARWKLRDGQDASTLEAALGERVAWPLYCLLLPFVVVPLVVRGRIGGAAQAMGRVLAVAAPTAALLFLAQALGRGGLIPAALVPWLAPLALALAGAAATWRMRWR